MYLNESETPDSWSIYDTSVSAGPGSLALYDTLWQRLLLSQPFFKDSPYLIFSKARPYLISFKASSYLTFVGNAFHTMSVKDPTQIRISFICRIQLQTRKSGVKNVWKLCPLRGGGVRRLMKKSILNFHFDYLTISLRQTITVKIIFFCTKYKIIHSLFVKSDFFANSPSVDLQFWKF